MEYSIYFHCDTTLQCQEEHPLHASMEASQTQIIGRMLAQANLLANLAEALPLTEAAATSFSPATTKRAVLWALSFPLPRWSARTGPRPS